MKSRLVLIKAGEVSVRAVGCQPVPNKEDLPDKPNQFSSRDSIVLRFTLSAAKICEV